VLFAGGLISIIPFASFIAWKGRKLLPARIIAQTPDVDPRLVLIARLSPCPNLSRDANGGWQVEDRDTKIQHP